MPRDTTVLPFRQPEAIDDPLSELAREGARRMLAQVLIAGADSFVAMQRNLVQAEKNPTPPQGVPYPSANHRRARARPLGRNANHLYEFALEGANPAAPRRPLSLFTAGCPL